MESTRGDRRLTKAGAKAELAATDPDVAALQGEVGALCIHAWDLPATPTRRARLRLQMKLTDAPSS